MIPQLYTSAPLLEPLDLFGQMLAQAPFALWMADREGKVFLFNEAMRDLVLESPSTELSEPIHDMLEYLIAQNRRANYVVAPPSALPVHVRLPDGSSHPVLQMSRMFLELPHTAVEL